MASDERQPDTLQMVVRTATFAGQPAPGMAAVTVSLREHPGVWHELGTLHMPESRLPWFRRMLARNQHIIVDRRKTEESK